MQPGANPLGESTPGASATRTDLDRGESFAETEDDLARSTS